MERETESNGVAYHEAGHCMAAYLVRQRFSKVSIIPHDDTLGFVLNPPSHWVGFRPDLDNVSAASRWRVEREIQVLLAGAIAEELLTGVDNFDGASQDFHTAAVLADYFCGSSEEVEAYLEWLRIRTKAMLELPWHTAAVKALAGELLTQKEIGYRKARAVIAEALKNYRLSLRDEP